MGERVGAGMEIKTNNAALLKSAEDLFAECAFAYDDRTAELREIAERRRNPRPLGRGGCQARFSDTCASGTVSHEEITEVLERWTDAGLRDALEGIVKRLRTDTGADVIAAYRECAA